MKTKIVVVAIHFMMAFNVHAQMYMGVQSGYGLGIQGRTLSDFLLVDAISSDIQGSSWFMDRRSSFGGGLKSGALVGYKINQYLGIEFVANFHKTNKVSTKITGLMGNGTMKVSLYGNIISLNPTVVCYIYKKGSEVYTKLGGVYNRGNFMLNLEETGISGQSSKKYKINEGQALGLSFSFGANWEIKKNLYLRTELDYISANYYPQKASIIKYVKDGQDQMSKINKKDYETIYAKTGTSNGEYYGQALHKGEVLRPQIPLSGFGFHVGFIYSWKK